MSIRKKTKLKKGTEKINGLTAEERLDRDRLIDYYGSDNFYRRTLFGDNPEGGVDYGRDNVDRIKNTRVHEKPTRDMSAMGAYYYDPIWGQNTIALSESRSPDTVIHESTHAASDGSNQLRSYDQIKNIISTVPDKYVNKVAFRTNQDKDYIREYLLSPEEIYSDIMGTRKFLFDKGLSKNFGDDVSDEIIEELWKNRKNNKYFGEYNNIKRLLDRTEDKEVFKKLLNEVASSDIEGDQDVMVAQDGKSPEELMAERRRLARKGVLQADYRTPPTITVPGGPIVEGTNRTPHEDRQEKNYRGYITGPDYFRRTLLGDKPHMAFLRGSDAISNLDNVIRLTAPDDHEDVRSGPGHYRSYFPHKDGTAKGATVEAENRPPGLTLHESDHAATDSKNELHSLKQIQNILPRIPSELRKLFPKDTDEEFTDLADYFRRPQEVHARITELRDYLYNAGYSNKWGEDVDDKTVKEMWDNRNNQNYFGAYENIRALIHTAGSKEALKKLLNEVASNDSKEDRDTMVAQDGGAVPQEKPHIYLPQRERDIMSNFGQYVNTGAYRGGFPLNNNSKPLYGHGMGVSGLDNPNILSNPIRVAPIREEEERVSVLDEMWNNRDNPEFFKGNEEIWELLQEVESKEELEEIITNAAKKDAYRLQQGGPTDLPTDEDINNKKSTDLINSIRTYLNYKNWGVPDYSSEKDYDTAYVKARKAGDKEFMWKGERKSTKNSGTSQQQYNMYGNTDALINAETDEPTKNAILKKSMQIERGNTRIDANKLDRLLDINRLAGSPTYKHTTNSSPLEEALFTTVKRNQPVTWKNVTESLIKDVPGKYGDDFKKEASKRSYFNPFTNSIGGLSYIAEEAHGYRNTQEGSEVLSFIRDYLKDPYISSRGQARGYRTRGHFENDTHRNVEPILKAYADGLIKKEDIKENIADLRNSGDLRRFFEVIAAKPKGEVAAIQRELSELGYKLPNSRTPNGGFDGVFGKETKAAIEDYKKRLTNMDDKLFDTITPKSRRNPRETNQFSTGGPTDPPIEQTKPAPFLDGLFEDIAFRVGKPGHMNNRVLSAARTIVDDDKRDLVPGIIQEAVERIRQDTGAANVVSLDKSEGEHRRSYYDESTNTIYLAPDDLQSYVAELSHSKLVKDNNGWGIIPGDLEFDRWVKKQMKRDKNEQEKIIKDGTYDGTPLRTYEDYYDLGDKDGKGSIYKTPGTTEYYAHEIEQPGIEKSFLDYINRGLWRNHTTPVMPRLQPQQLRSLSDDNTNNNMKKHNNGGFVKKMQEGGDVYNGTFNPNYFTNIFSQAAGSGWGLESTIKRLTNFGDNPFSNPLEGAVSEAGKGFGEMFPGLGGEMKDWKNGGRRDAQKSILDEDSKKYNTKSIADTAAAWGKANGMAGGDPNRTMGAYMKDVTDRAGVQYDNQKLAGETYNKYGKGLMANMVAMDELNNQEQLSYNKGLKNAQQDLTKGDIGTEFRGFFARNGMAIPTVNQHQQTMGYKSDSPYRNLPEQRFYTDTLTMNGVDKPILAVSDNGIRKIMQPNSGNYKFSGARFIDEIPLARGQRSNFQDGGTPEEGYTQQGQMSQIDPETEGMQEGIGQDPVVEVVDFIVANVEDNIDQDDAESLKMYINEGITNGIDFDTLASYVSRDLDMNIYNEESKVIYNELIGGGQQQPEQQEQEAYNNYPDEEIQDDRGGQEIELQRNGGIPRINQAINFSGVRNIFREMPNKIYADGGAVSKTDTSYSSGVRALLDIPKNEYIPTDNLVPVQTEKGELIIHPTGDISRVMATKRHSKMKPDEVTDITPEGAYILSAYGDVKINRDEAKNIITEVGIKPYRIGDKQHKPTEKTLGDFMTKKTMSPAEVGRAIEKAFPVISSDDPFILAANNENKRNRVPYLEALVQLSELDKMRKGLIEIPEPGSEQEQGQEQMEQGNDGEQFKSGGSIYRSNTKSAQTGGPPSPYSLISSAVNGLFGLAGAALQNKYAKQAYNDVRIISNESANKQGELAGLGTAMGVMGIMNQNPTVEANYTDPAYIRNMQVRTPNSVIDSANTMAYANMPDYMRDAPTWQAGLAAQQASYGQVVGSTGTLRLQQSMADQAANNKQLEALQGYYKMNNDSATGARNATNLNRNAQVGAIGDKLHGLFDSRAIIESNKANTDAAARLGQAASQQQFIKTATDSARVMADGTLNYLQNQNKPAPDTSGRPFVPGQMLDEAARSYLPNETFPPGLTPGRRCSDGTEYFQGIGGNWIKAFKSC